MVSHASEPQRCVRQVRNCGSLDVLWFVWVGPTSFKYGLTVKYEITKKKLPRCKHAHSFRIFSLEFCFLTPAFSSMFLHVSHAFDTLKIPVHRFGCQDIIKNSLERFASSFSMVMPFSNECEHTKLRTLPTPLLINLSWAIFLPAIPWEGLNKFRGAPYSSSSGYCTLYPPLQVSFAYFFWKSATPISLNRLFLNS